MVNTVVQRTLVGGGNSRYIVREITIISDGSEETDLVIYDNSAFIANVNKGRLMKVQASGSSCVCRLEWDQTTDAVIASFDPAYTQEINFEAVGGHANPKATGATGDIVLSTTSLDNGDEVTLIITVKQ